jgi:choline dehydrogenase-like flavoprotein
MIHSGQELLEDTTREADLVVVGSGAGGGMLLRDAALAGLRVIALEEGGHHEPASFTQRERDMLPRLFQDAGGRQTVDGAITVLQGRGVGGSTVHNTNLCKRAPDRVLEEWVERFGLAAWRPARLADDFAAVEALLHVSDIDPGQVNRNNELLLRGMKQLGWRGGLLRHNRRGCIGSGFCELGCAYDAKENVTKVLLPEALAHGAELWTECRAERVLVEAGRAVGVVARALREGRPGPTLTIRARAVALAGSAVGSAALARASELWDPHGLVGRNLHLHPAAAEAGQFDEPVEGYVGIPQSVECTEFIDWEPGSPRRIWIVPAFAHPVGLVAMMPGFGASHMRLARRYRYLAVLAAMLHDESSGEVRATRAGRPELRYRLNETDRSALGRGMQACGQLLLAAGAREVMVPLTRPLVAKSERELLPLATHAYRPLDPLLSAVHPMGTLPMAASPEHGVTDGRGAWHGVKGLYVADGSLFPTSLGGPPQITIYTVGRRVARSILEDLRHT